MLQSLHGSAGEPSGFIWSWGVTIAALSRNLIKKGGGNINLVGLKGKNPTTAHLIGITNTLPELVGIGKLGVDGFGRSIHEKG